MSAVTQRTAPSTVPAPTPPAPRAPTPSDTAAPEYSKNCVDDSVPSSSLSPGLRAAPRRALSLSALRLPHSDALSLSPVRFLPVTPSSSLLPLSQFLALGIKTSAALPIRGPTSTHALLLALPLDAAPTWLTWGDDAGRPRARRAATSAKRAERQHRSRWRGKRR